MAVLTDYGVKDGTLIGNPSAGNYYRFMDLNNSYALTIRDSAGLDSVYTTGVIPTNMDSRIIVNQANAATTLGGVIDSTKEYFIDGVIDMSAITITVPSTGLFITGYDSEVSQLVCADNGYTMFDGTAGSGNILMKDLAIEVSGTSSMVYDLLADTGFEAIETSGVNYNDCTSRGTIDGYRQGLDENLGIFGGSPNLILAGAWIGGYKLVTTIVRGLDDGWAGSLFEEGVGFTMGSRFITDMNVDLGTSSSLLNFRPANFTESSLLQLVGCLVTRNGVADPADTNITPNISSTDLESLWRNNQGLPNTYVGATGALTTEVATATTGLGVFTTLAGLWTTTDAQHFDNPAQNQWRNLGSSPRDFKIIVNVILDGDSNDQMEIRVRKFDASASTTSTVVSQIRQVINAQGSNDVAIFTILGKTTLDINDYVFLEVANNTTAGADTCTALLNSFITVEER